MTESQYLTATYAFDYFGPVRIKLLLSYFKTAKRIWLAKTNELLETGIPTKKVLEFDRFRKDFDPKKYFKRLKDSKVRIATIFDSDYPSNLKDLEGAPYVLYYKGKIKDLDEKSVAIVGSRKMTLYGQEIAGKFSSDLAKAGITIVSGLARGIDTAAHMGALLVGGKTVAVLGHGLDIVYPTENIKLAEEIVNSGGVLISEYPLGYPPLPANFRARNRIISGISSVVLVIEGAEKSGTLVTASHAAEQGKTVFAVPGPITSPTSWVPHFLIKNGARVATSTSDILEELRIQDKVGGGS